MAPAACTGRGWCALRTPEAKGLPSCSSPRLVLAVSPYGVGRPLSHVSCHTG